MSRLTIMTLGRAEVRRDGQLLAFRTRKAHALLIYLVVDRGVHAREKLAELLWPEAAPGRGRMMLRTTLTHLRQAMEAGMEQQDVRSWLVSQGDALALQLPPGTVVDLDQVTAAVQAVHIAASPTETSDTEELLAQLQAAAGCYQGDFLSGFGVDGAPEFDGWIGRQRAYWQRQMSIVFDGLCRLLADRGQLPQALQMATRWVAHDPWLDAARRRQMEFYVATGDPVTAIQLYETYRKELAEELQVEPPADLTALAARLRREPRSRPGSTQPAPYASYPPGPEQLAKYVPLAGRSHEFARSVAAFHAAQTGVPQAVVLCGEAGIGKTRLATEFLAWATAEGGSVLRGRAFEASWGLPYHLVVDALRPHLERVNAPEDLLGDVWLAELSRLFPELRERYDDLVPPFADEAAASPRLFEAIAQLVLALARQTAQASGGPLVIFLDDIQWADATSLDLLVYTAQRWTEAHAPVLLLLALREEVPSAAALPVAAAPADACLVALGRLLPLSRLRLPALDGEQILQLILALAGVDSRERSEKSPPLRRVGEWLFGETAGQPFFVVEILKLLLDQHLMVPQLDSGGDWVFDFTVTMQAIRARSAALEIPLSVREMILARLAPLSLDAVELLAAAAVLGDPIDFDQARRVADMGEREGLAALDDLLRRGLLRTAGRLYEFSHDKVREILYMEAGDARRRVYHRRALAVLEGTSPPAGLAHHALAAGLNERALAFSMAAGAEALRLFATQDAIVHFEVARRLLDSAGHAAGLEAVPGDLRQHLYLSLGRAYELVERWDGAEAIYRELVDYARRHVQSRLHWAGLNRLATLLVWSRFDLVQAERLLQEAWSVAASSDDQMGLAETAWNRAQIGIYTYDPLAAVHAEQSLALARELDRPELIARCLNVLAHVQSNFGGWQQIVTTAEEASGRYAELGDWAMEADCLTLLAIAKSNLGQSRDALVVARRALARAVQVDNRWGQAFAGSALALTLADLGYYAEALETARQALEFATQLGFLPLVVLCRTALAVAELSVGAVTAARITITDAWVAYRTTGTPTPMTELLAGLLCAAYALEGDWAAAYDYARHALNARDPAVAISPQPTRVFEVEALLRGGDLAAALEDLNTMGRHLDRGPRQKLAYLRAHAVLCRWQGQIPQALDDLEAARDLAADMSLPGEEWQTLAELVTVARAAGDAAREQAARERCASILRSVAERIPEASLRRAFWEWGSGRLNSAIEASSD